MTTHPVLPSKLWERTPCEVQDYILALEARVAALEATVQELLEQRAAGLAHVVASALE